MLSHAGPLTHAWGVSSYRDEHVRLALERLHGRKEDHQKDRRHHKLVQRHLDEHGAHAARLSIQDVEIISLLVGPNDQQHIG